MNCRAQAKPAPTEPAPYVSPYIRRALERCKLIPNHGPLCPSCFSDPDQGWNTATGRCGNCGHVKGAV